MEVRLTLAVCVLVAFLQAGQGASDTDTYRLPQTCKPSTCELYIRPDFYNSNVKPTFSGSVNITVTCSASTNRMTLHQHNLDFQEKTVTSVQNGEMLSFREEKNTEHDFYTLVLNNGREFKANVPYKLSFTFSGVMGTSSGLFYSSYVSDEGHTVRLAATHMQPTYARSVFPCFDEPGFKATFSASIARRTDTGRDYSTLFNSRLIKSEIDPKDPRWTVDVYGPTPVMSTYLVALVVSDFVAVTENIDLGKVHNGTENGKLFPYWTLVKPGSKEKVKKAHGHGIALFSWMDKHLLPPYENFLSKIDNVAIPTFIWGGMENWGLNLYHSKYYEYTSGQTPMKMVKVAMSITSHEIIHQWFGNLVSLKWWKYLWLNEGFATFWEYYGPQQVAPKWKQEELLVSSMDLAIMQTDGSKDSHPLNNPVQSPKEIEDMFDQYSYHKGGAIVRMLHMILGDHSIPAFNHYLQKHQLSVVDSDDLWTALDEYGKEHGLYLQLSERMPSWVEQKGYPVLSATRNENQEQVTFTQEIFPVKDMDTNFQTPFRNHFDIPIQLSTDGDFLQKNTSTHPPQWFSRNDAEMTMHVAKGASWYVVNEDHRGYYRVLYDEDNYEKLYDQLMNDHKVFTPLTRATILDDALTFYKTGGKYREVVKAWPFRLTRYLKNEFSFPAWEVFRREMEHYRPRLMFADRSLFNKYKRFVQSITGPVLKNLTLDIESDAPPYDSYIRTWLAELACKSGEHFCVISGFIEISPYRMFRVPFVNLKEAMFCGALQGFGSLRHDIFNLLVAELPNVTNSDKRKSLAALGCTPSKSDCDWLLKDTLRKEIPGMESGSSMAMLLEEFAMSKPRVTLKFLKKNFESILHRINDTEQSQDMLRKMFRYLTDGTNLAEIVEPLLKKLISMGDSWEQLAEQTEVITKENADYIDNNRHIFEAWLGTQS